jgi:50S ribosomal subunit-associated GTPase HflX
MEELVERISEFVGRGTMTVDLRLPSERADLLARLHREGAVRELKYEEGFTRVVAAIPTRSLEVFAPFLSVPEASSAGSCSGARVGRRSLADEVLPN